MLYASIFIFLIDALLNFMFKIASISALISIFAPRDIMEIYGLCGKE